MSWVARRFARGPASVTAPSSSGLGHRPFTPATRVRVPLGSLSDSGGRRMSRVLITAFGPYGHWAENSSWLALVELTRSLPPAPEITTRLYPVDLAAVSERLAQDLARAGLCDPPGPSPRIDERAAGGDRHQRGRPLPTTSVQPQPLVPDGPVAYQSQLPLAAWAGLLRDAGIPAWYRITPAPISATPPCT